MRALVIGGDSKLGAALCARLLERGHDVTFTTRRDDDVDEGTPSRKEKVLYLDMLDPKIPAELDAGYDPYTSEPYVVYIMAAITGVVPGEKHPDAWRVNAEAPVALTLQAKERGWPVVFMSSGTVEMAQHTASAMQKRYAEAIVHLCGGCVVRPLPTVPREKYEELADLLIDVGEEGRTGLVRWGA